MIVDKAVASSSSPPPPRPAPATVATSPLTPGRQVRHRHRHQRYRPDVFAYTFAWPGGRRAIAFGLVSLCNRSSTPNAEIESNRKERTLRLVAAKPIRPGEEILITYSYFPPEWDR